MVVGAWLGFDAVGVLGAVIEKKEATRLRHDRVSNVSLIFFVRDSRKVLIR